MIPDCDSLGDFSLRNSQLFFILCLLEKFLLFSNVRIKLEKLNIEKIMYGKWMFELMLFMTANKRIIVIVTSGIHESFFDNKLVKGIRIQMDERYSQESFLGTKSRASEKNWASGVHKKRYFDNNNWSRTSEKQISRWHQKINCYWFSLRISFILNWLTIRIFLS